MELKNAPVWFHNAVARLFAGIAFCETIFDGACVGGRSFEEFYKGLVEFLDRCIINNVKLKASKTKLGLKEVRFVGHIINGNSIHIDPKRCNSFVEAEAPRTREELHSYLGSVNWLSSFIPHLATLIAPMWNLLNTTFLSFGAPPARLASKL